MRRVAAWLLPFLASCRFELPASTIDASEEGTPDDGAPSADALDRWTTPQRIQGASATATEDDVTLSSTTNELVFSVIDPAANNTKDLWYMSRLSPADAWSTPMKLGFNTTTSDETPRFSADDLTLYFASGRVGGPGNLDIYRVTRMLVGDTWSAPQLVPGVSTAGVDKSFTPCAADSSYLTILGNDIGEGTLGSPPTVIAELSSGASETGAFLASDCRTVYFASNRSGTNRIYRATRTAVGAPWSAPEVIDEFLALGGNQEDPWMSVDLRTFAFVSDAAGSKDIYLSTR